MRNVQVRSMTASNLFHIMMLHKPTIFNSLLMIFKVNRFAIAKIDSNFVA